MTRIVLALVATLFAYTSCSTVNDIFGAANAPGKALQKEAGLDGPGTCCVNKQFYECPEGGAALQCLGEPFELSSCVDKCPMGAGDNCELKCIGEHGPDPSGCTRAPARDAECPQ